MIRRFTTPEELARAAANAWLEEVASAHRADAPAFSVALSGGRIAGALFSAAVRLAAALPVSFERTHFFWADERCIPPRDAESNFRVAMELLLTPLRVAGDQIHRIRGEEPPDAAAAAASAELCGLAPSNSAGQPVLDLVLLGMGEDGHVASLFPGEPEAMRANPAVYRAVRHSPKPPPDRVTLGYPALAAARMVWVLASGAGKETALRESLDPAGQTPLAKLVRLRRETTVFTDIKVD
jgi:6-phosphogluconolactonase